MCIRDRSIVSFRILLWKNYNQVNLKFKPPTFGLNFLESKDIKDKNIMLLSGFEKFDRFFVRIDILERLFMQIINSEKEVKLIPEMLNLLGCGKENFKKLLLSMNYKILEKNDEIFFRYVPKKIINKNINKKTSKESPFGILKDLNLS